MEPNAPVATPLSDQSKQGKGKGLVAATVVASVVAVCGIGFGVYGMMKMNTGEGPVETSNSNSQTTNNEPSDQALNAYETNDLRTKTLRLLGSRNGLSIRDYYDSNSRSFIVLSSYMPITRLVTNELDDSSKVYITLETTVLDKEKYCNYQWTDGVKDDIVSALGQQASNIDFGNTNMDCISYDKANSDHSSLWGESMPKINGTSSADVGDFAYGSNLDAYYYHIMGGRGGLCSGYVVGRIANIGNNQDYAYVDINAGSFDVCADSAGELYSDVERGELYKTIDQDNIDWNGLGLTVEDYEALQPYRFIFKKNSDGIYSFSTVEKL